MNEAIEKLGQPPARMNIGVKAIVVGTFLAMAFLIWSLISGGRTSLLDILAAGLSLTLVFGGIFYDIRKGKRS